MNTTVYKVGGSLLSWAELPDRLLRLVAERPRERPLIVLGGGRAADLVRRWDQVHGLGQERSHWLALQAVALNEALLADLLPEACGVADRQEAESAWTAGRLPVLRSLDFLRDEESTAESSLPQNWDVTGDSIAAWVALRWPADELVLVKSADLPEDRRPANLSRLGLLDGYFPRLADRLSPVSWVNLRDSGCRIQRLSG